MTARPAVSVVIPTYNREQLIRRAIESARAASRPGDEIIVVDDGSTDGTAGVLAGYGEAIRVVRGRHAGAGAARNLGIEHARGPYVALLDSDDEWRPDMLELSRCVLDARPDVVFTFGNFEGRGHGEVRRMNLASWHTDRRPWGEILAPGTRFSSLAPLPPSRDDFDVHIGDLYLAGLFHDYIATFTLVARLAALPDRTWFAEDLPFHEDVQCFARLCAVGNAAYLDCEIATQHGHDGPRLTQTSVLAKANARLELITRWWGGDPKFIERHGDAYRRRVRDARLARAKLLLREGRTRDAREDLRAVPDASLPLRMFSTLPGPLARAAARFLGR